MEPATIRTAILLAVAAIVGLAGCTYECNASNCADGCCGENGVCLVNGGDAFCGLGGAACQDCSAQQRICGSDGTCGLACASGTPCGTSADCCSNLICWKATPGASQGECTTCRQSGESCNLNEDCCGYPSFHCARPDGVHFTCR